MTTSIHPFIIISEDNNTRVLFERVLSSGNLEPENSVDIWNRFLEFESNIGDLVSIVKVEKRRSAVLEKVNIIFLFSLIYVHACIHIRFLCDTWN